MPLTLTQAAVAPPSFERARAVLAEFGAGHRDLVAHLAVCGSVAEATAGPGSDVDVLLAFAPEARPRGLDYFGRMEELRAELTTLLGAPVDLLDRAAVEADPNPRRRAGILNSARPVYGAS